MRVFSGIQPSGSIHIGNYFGAIKNLINIQQNKHSHIHINANDSQFFFMVADLHSLTTNSKIHGNSLKTAASLFAMGINIDSCILFRQSQVLEHAQLAWILSCQTTVSRIQSMIQWKQKSGDKAGLLFYPILQSADILLYKSDFVPVGIDQSQHVELCRDIANSVNTSIGSNIFKIPQIVLSDTPKIFNISDGESKMSKSGGYKSFLSIEDTEDDIRAKITKSKTDSIQNISYDPENRPQVSNLIFILSLITDTRVDQISSQYKHLNSAQFKLILIDALIEFWKPFRFKYNELMQTPNDLIKILESNEQKARSIARDTISEYKKMVGL